MKSLLVPQFVPHYKYWTALPRCRAKVCLHVRICSASLQKQQCYLMEGTYQAHQLQSSVPVHKVGQSLCMLNNAVHCRETHTKVPIVKLTDA